MVASTANPADYRQVRVMSLWGSHSGFILARDLVGYLILPTTVFRYSTP
jgi:hypothetical protein